MSGNRMKLKNGLLLGVLLSTTFFGYGLEMSQVDSFVGIFDDLTEWSHQLCDPKHKDKVALIKSLDALVVKVDGFIPTIPDTPPADPLLKTILQDLHDGLKITHNTFLNAKSVMDFRSTGAASCSLQPMLEKAKKDLDVLISHIEAHPDIYTADVLQALKKFRSIKFEKFYREFHPKDWNSYYTALRKYFRLI